MPAEDVKPEDIALFLKITCGIICCSITKEKSEILNLPPMIINNTDPNQTAFTVSVDHQENTTGISAIDRALTFNKLALEDNPHNFRRPGHVFPLVAKNNGVLERQGHTEATLDFMKLADKQPCGILSEITSQDKLTMAKLPELEDMIKSDYDFVLTSIEDLICYRIKYEDIEN